MIALSYFIAHSSELFRRTSCDVDRSIFFSPIIAFKLHSTYTRPYFNYELSICNYDNVNNVNVYFCENVLSSLTIDFLK